MKKIFSPEKVQTTQAQFSFDTTELVNFLAEGAVTRLSNGLYERLEAGTGPRHLRHAISPGCRCMGCYSWQIVELDPAGGENVVDETEDLMDWLDE